MTVDWYVCMYVCMLICSMAVHWYICMYVCMCACMLICTDLKSAFHIPRVPRACIPTRNTHAPMP
jgi:hypothetical protein